MPSSASEVLRRVGDERALKDRQLTDAEWRSSGERQILNAGALWPRIEAEKGTIVSDQTQPPAPPAAPVTSTPAPATQAGPAPVETPSTITIDDFMKIHLKVAKVLEAEKMPKSQKLLKLKVDAGEAEPRTILAGIAESYEPEALVGKSIVIVANLAPRKMMGIESNGMVLAASPDGGAAIVLNSEPATPGTRVR
jgi:methionyl-tRNA synthetase